MNKHNIILAILFLVIGFTGGLFLTQKYKPVIDNQEQEIVPSEQEIDKSKISSNKLFEFLDSKKDFYTDPVYKDGGEIDIIELDHNLGLMMVEYPTSQESSNYAVYDYKNNLFYDKVGNSGLDEVPNMPNAKPEVFINQDQVLVRSGINSDETNSSEYPLSVKNFRTGEIVKVLPIKFDLKSRYYNQVRFSQLQDGKIYIYVSQVLNGNKILPDVTYILDVTTLEVNKAR